MTHQGPSDSLRFVLSGAGQTIAALFAVSVIAFALVRVGFPMIPAGLMSLHSIWLDKA